MFVDDECKYIEHVLDLDTVPEYVWSLFVSFLDEIKMKNQNGALWLNHDDLDKDKYRDIKMALLGEGKLFDLLSIDKEHVPSVQQYRWKIDGAEYETMRSLPVSDYVTSVEHQYIVDGVGAISFHFRCYGCYSADNPQCAIFLKFDGIPDNLECLRIEVDIKCVKNKIFRQLLTTRILTKDRNYCGFQAFECAELDENECIEWVFGVKIFKIKQYAVERELEEQYLMDLYKEISR